MLGGPLDQLARQAAVAEDIELEPAGRSGSRGRHLLRSRVGDRREAHQRSRRGGRACHSALAVGMGEPLERDGRDEKRHRDGRAEHSRRGRDLRDVDEHARPEAQPLPGREVARQHALVAGAAGIEAEGAGLEPRLRETLEVGDADGLAAQRPL